MAVDEVKFPEKNILEFDDVQVLGGIWKSREISLIVSGDSITAVSDRESEPFLKPYLEKMYTLLVFSWVSVIW